MSRRLASHPAVLIAALAVATVVGALAVGSLVQVLAVGTSRLGLETPPGVVVSVILAVLSMATIAAIMLAVARGAGGYDDEDFRRGGDEPDRPPPTDGPYGEPEWWPEFERGFASYVTDAHRARRRDAPVGVP